MSPRNDGRPALEFYYTGFVDRQLGLQGLEFASRNREMGERGRVAVNALFLLSRWTCAASTTAECIRAVENEGLFMNQAHLLRNDTG